MNCRCIHIALHCDIKHIAGMRISFHFRRKLLQYGNDNLQFALWYGIAMLHWRPANCSVHVALRITASQNWWFAVCAVQVTLYIISGQNWWFAICAMQVTCQCTAVQHWWLSIRTVQFISQCNVAPVTCNLWCVTVVSSTAVNSGELQCALCKLYYVDKAVQQWRLAICSVQVTLYGIAVLNW
jgi:hypothetical protein